MQSNTSIKCTGRKALVNGRAHNPPVTWLSFSGEDGFPEGSYKVEHCSIGPHLIVATTRSDDVCIIRPFVPSNVVPTADMKYLAAGQGQLTWVPFVVGHLPPNAIRYNEQMGEYGFMFIGSRDECGVGMVVAIAEDSYEFYTYDSDEAWREGFKILCRA